MCDSMDELGGIMLSEKLDTEGQMLPDCTYMKELQWSYS